ncbi:MAG: hypothetical protein WBA51_02535 [Erythrobacter sp.]
MSQIVAKSDHHQARFSSNTHSATAYRETQRRLKHGRVLPMQEPTLWERLLRRG